jgi:hypothetical protein
VAALAVDPGELGAVRGQVDEPGVEQLLGLLTTCD